MRQITKFFIFAGALAVIAAVVLQRAPSVAADKATDNPYDSVSLRQGVWNDGQSALWDLNIIDHFHYFGPADRARGHKPEQPVKFSHVTHVQKNKMDCQYCHWTVDKSPYAAIPEVATCMGCHNIIGGTTPDQQEQIGVLKKHWESGSPIPWQKVHVMPDYVRFDHERHVKGGVGCHECHGQIPKMEVVERVSSMKMGWCLDCHRMKGTTIDCYACHY